MAWLIDDKALSLRVSLARKISLLFGTAVLLIIGVTLLFPWLQMNWLDEEAMLMQAHWVATAALQAAEPLGPDWSAAQAEVRRRWPALVRQTGLPPTPPELVPVEAVMGEGFRQEAVARLSRDELQRYFWRVQDDGRRFRYALALRAGEGAAHPAALVGMVDVRLPIPPRKGLWNDAVTVLAGASGAVLAILVFYMVTQRLVLGRVAALQAAAEQVTRGDLDVRATIRSGDEFEDLAQSFNEMLTSLKAAQEELRKTNRSLDIRLGELAETNVALYEANRLKGEFLANVTHELRTPLVSIIGFAELLRDAWESPEADRHRLRRFTENILTSGRSLLEIINDLLDLAKIEAGKMELHVVDFSLVELCHDMMDFIRPLADKKQQRLEPGVAEDLPRMHSDPGKVKQILYNLLSNAVKFTPAEGVIALAVAPEGASRVRITVRDTGPGIPAEQQGRIFEKFHQIDSSKTREYEGTGLGLAITRELVHVLGGTVRLESKAGEGATFVVELPVAIRR